MQTAEFSKNKRTQLALIDLLSTLSTPIMMIDGELYVHYHNQASAKLLSQSREAFLQNGKLQFGLQAIARRFDSMLETAILESRSTGRATAKVLRVPRAPTDLILMIYVRSAWLASPADALALVVFGELRLRSDVIEYVREVNGFTRTESAVVQELMEGHRLTDICVKLKIAPETVRAHVKRVFKKCGVHTQAQLVQTIAMQLFTVLPFCEPR